MTSSPRYREPRSRLIYTSRYRARRDGVAHTITVDDLDWPTHCPVLGVELAYGQRGRAAYNSASLDRVDPTLGYVPGNVRVISWRANNLKTNATYRELRAVAQYMAREGEG